MFFPKMSEKVEADLETLQQKIERMKAHLDDVSGTIDHLGALIRKYEVLNNIQNNRAKKLLPKKKEL